MLRESPRLHPSPPRSEENGPARQTRAALLLLGGILLLGLALRLYGIGSYPFEQDELYTAIEATHLFDSPLKPGIEARPLYYLLQHALFVVAPVSHVALRLLPLLFGVAGIVATWFLGARLFGVAGGAVSAFLVAVSPWHLHASGMARYWSLVYLLSALFCLFLFTAGRRDRPRDYLAVLVVLLLGIASHPTFAFPLVGIVLGTLLVRADGRMGWSWPSRNAWTYLWIPAALLLGAAYLALKLVERGASIRNFDGRGLTATLKLVPAMVEWLTPTMFMAGALGAVVIFASARQPDQRRWGAAALLGAVGTVVALVAASLVTDVYADYGMAMLPLVFVSAGGAVALGAERMAGGGRVFAAVAAAVLLAGVLPSLVSHLFDGMRFDYRPAFQRIAATDPGVTVLSTPIVLQRHYAPELRGEELRFERAFLDRTLAEQRDLWLVAPLRRDGLQFDGTGEGAAWITDHCKRVDAYERPRLDYRMYRVELYRCRA